MNRQEFLKGCAAACVLGLPGILQSCAATHYLDAAIEGDSLVLSKSEFFTEKDGLKKPRPFVVVQNEKLEYPICVYHFGGDEYKALWMKCTHQGTELQVFGDRLQCPAHGSEFTNRGAVQNGPADAPLRTFEVSADGDKLKIRLS